VGLLRRRPFAIKGRRSRVDDTHMSAAGWKETRLLLTFVLVGLLVTAAIAIMLHHGHNLLRPVALTSVARAAYVTGSQPGYRFALQIETNGAGQSLIATATGSISPSGRGSLHLTATGVSIEEILAYPDIYVRTPSVPTGTALASTPWLKVNAAAMMQSLGARSSISGDSDPSQTLDYLKAGGMVTRVGSARVRGVLTTHYHALVDLNRYASVVPASRRAEANQVMAVVKRVTGQGTLPIDAWIDGQNRVRRVQMRVPMCTPLGRFSESFSMDIFAYGRRPTVAIPVASEVTDVTSRIMAQESLARQQLSCK
jgi:hypothetical protein